MHIGSVACIVVFAFARIRMTLVNNSMHCFVRNSTNDRSIRDLGAEKDVLEREDGYRINYGDRNSYLNKLQYLTEVTNVFTKRHLLNVMRTNICHRNNYY